MDGTKAAVFARRTGRGKEALRLWLRLLLCQRMVEQRLRTRLREHFEVTLPQFDVLSELERAGSPLTMTQLSNELMVTNGNITGLIDRLERDALVSRTPGEGDRRVQYIALTGRGASLFRLMAQMHETWIAEVFADLTKTDMRVLQTLLLKARASAASGQKQALKRRAGVESAA